VSVNAVGCCVIISKFRVCLEFVWIYYQNSVYLDLTYVNRSLYFESDIDGSDNDVQHSVDFFLPGYKLLT
jgi:hypothetical protein